MTDPKPNDITAESVDHRQNELRFVLFKDGDSLSAVCLERWIGAQGRSEDETLRRLKCVYRAELDASVRRTGKPFGGMPPAPPKYHRIHESGGDDVLCGTIYDRRGDRQPMALAA